MSDPRLAMRQEENVSIIPIGGGNAASVNPQSATQEATASEKQAAAALHAKEVHAEKEAQQAAWSQVIKAMQQSSPPATPPATGGRHFLDV
jgi:hypothetical protein